MQLSPGSWTILVLAAVSSVILFFWPIPRHVGRTFWTFTLEHDLLYEPQIAAWNAQQVDPHERWTAYVISGGAQVQRLQSGFLSGTPVPDATEVESSAVPTFFSGPLSAVGFTDLTDVVRREGLDRKFNPPSLAPWTNRGRLFGLPHDVHPVLLAYRADIVEAAGIDVSRIETWDDFVRVMRPLLRGPNGPRFLLNVWETNQPALEILLLQAGGGFFDAQLRPILDSDANARVLARIVTWITGPGRIGVDAPNFDANGNFLYLNGDVLCTLMPDWLAGVWQKDLGGLSGKVKLMPLPAWQPGGLRTSVLGGTMIGIPKRADFARAWPFVKYLYTSREVAEKLYQTTDIITPVREFWSDPVFDQPNPYFRGQPIGRLYIQMADKIPLRTSSPFKPDALAAIQDALARLRRYADSTGTYDETVLRAQARRELAIAQADIERRIAANAFLATSP